MSVAAETTPQKKLRGPKKRRFMSFVVPAKGEQAEKTVRLTVSSSCLTFREHYSRKPLKLSLVAAWQHADNMANAPLFTAPESPTLFTKAGGAS